MTTHDSGNADIWSSLDRYLAGESAPEERARVEAWLRADPGRSALLESLRASLQADRPAWNTSAAWVRLQQRIAGDDAASRSAPIPLTPRRRPALSPAAWLRIAAVVATLAMGSLAAWRLLRHPAPAAMALNTVFVTPPGHRDTLRLVDGSDVVLAPASHLELAAGFGTIERRVRLQGQAFFRVTHDAARPFRVQTERAVIEDLGTEFSVRVVAPDLPLEVAVLRGRVALLPDSPGARTVLVAGQVGRVAPDGSTQISGDVRARLAWLDGFLDFDNASLGEVVRELSRWFGVAVQLSDSTLRSRHVSGRFTASSMNAVLDALSLSLGVRYEHRDSAWVLLPSPH